MSFHSHFLGFFTLEVLMFISQMGFSLFYIDNYLNSELEIASTRKIDLSHFKLWLR